MKHPFTLPSTWAAEPYPTHCSFAYESHPQRDDFDFRVEFTESVPEAEQLAVIALLESAPRLLECLMSFVAWTELHGLNTAPLISGGQAEVPVVVNARAVLAEVMGREGHESV